jgi:signal transduction histidine kinase
VCTITGGRRRVEQALPNLLSNAVKFAEKGSISLTCDTINKELTLSVKDTGVGIELMGGTIGVKSQRDKAARSSLHCQYL